LKPFSVWGILVPTMAWTGKWRSFLALWLVFAVSPLSMCAQTVCDLSCSLHETTAYDSGLHKSKGHEALAGSVKRSADMHCHKLSDSPGTHSGAFVDRNGVCHGNNCLLAEVGTAPAAAQVESSNAPARGIGLEALNAIALGNPALTGVHRLPESCVRCSDAFAVSGTLRI